MKFQTGHEDPNKPDKDRKPKLAVTTRTLEALIRLATAHAKLKLRQDEVLKEDVVEAYKLMLLAREEDVQPDSTAPSVEEVIEDQALEPEGKRRKRDLAGGKISAGRLDALQGVAARVFASKGEAEMSLTELRDGANANLMAGEKPFDDVEFRAGLDELESKNKMMVIADSDLVVLIA